MNSIALTIDIEDWYHTPAVSGSDFSVYKNTDEFMQQWKSKYDFLTEPTFRILKILNDLNLTATFFIVADIITYYPSLVDEILKGGHEIACHGLHHALKINSKTKKPLFTSTEFEDRTGQAKEMLEKHTGKKVTGYRAPGAYFGQWMFESLIDLGFEYDSSISSNSFYNKTDFKTAGLSSSPYRVYNSAGNRSLIEIPWSFIKIGKVKFPTGGGPFLRFFPTTYTIAGLRDSLKRGDCLFYFHPIDISKEKLPGLASDNSRRPFYYSTSGLKTENKIKKILSVFEGKWTNCESMIKSYHI